MDRADTIKNDGEYLVTETKYEPAGGNHLSRTLDHELSFGHRLSFDTRERLFDAVTDLANKHHLPIQNMSGLPGVAEAGDICGDVEKLALGWLRALHIAALNGDENGS